jgi:hypothetical protein
VILPDHRPLLAPPMNAARAIRARRGPPSQGPMSYARVWDHRGRADGADVPADFIMIDKQGDLPPDLSNVDMALMMRAPIPS